MFQHINNMSGYQLNDMEYMKWVIRNIFQHMSNMVCYQLCNIDYIWIKKYVCAKKIIVCSQSFTVMTHAHLDISLHWQLACLFKCLINNKNIKVFNYWTFVKGSYWWPVVTSGFLNQRVDDLESVPCHKITMITYRKHKIKIMENVWAHKQCSWQSYIVEQVNDMK